MANVPKTKPARAKAPPPVPVSGEVNIKTLLDYTIEHSASDLLITAGSAPWVRVNGELEVTPFAHLNAAETQRLVYSVLDPKQRAQFEERKELDLSLAAVDAKHRFRVNVYYQKGSVAAAFRAIPSRLPRLEELGMPKVVQKFAFRAQGLILVTGPTGHGKTTTQAALIDLINSHRKCHIITIEDPIEYVHEHKKGVVDQREVGEDTASFAAALKYVLRQDPDVILVGEMRDLETISSALTAAETGHLVIATLHTNDASQTIDRIVDVFPAHQQQQIRIQLAMSLLAVISQRLLPRANGTGRVMAVEILRKNAAIGNLIREGKTHQIYSIMETHTKDGMVTLDTSIKNLYMRGIVSFDTAVNNVSNPQIILDGN